MGMKENSIKKNAILNIIYTSTNLLFPLITYPYVLRIISADGIGKVQFFTSIENYAVMLAGLGISTYGIREVAKNRSDENKLEVAVSELLTINMLSTFIIAFVYFALVLTIPRFSKELGLGLINGVIIITAPFGMNWFFSGLEKYEYITKRTIAFKIISLVMIFLLIHRDADYILYAIILAFSNVGAFVCNYLYAKKILKFSYKKKVDLAHHMKPMFVLFASTLAINVYINLDTVMLGIIRTDRDVGMYSTAVKVKVVLLQIVNAISTVLFPRLTYYLSQGKIQEYNNALKKSFSIILSITIPLTIYFEMMAEECILILGGKEYIDAVTCMRILLPILVVSGFSNITGNQILIPNGKDTAFMKAVSVGALVDFLLNLVFMKEYGFNGAALATLIAEITQMTIQSIYSRKHILNNISASIVLRPCLSASLSCVLIIIVSKYITHIFLRMIITSIGYFGFYIILQVFFGDLYIKEYLMLLLSRLGILKNE